MKGEEGEAKGKGEKVSNSQTGQSFFPVEEPGSISHLDLLAALRHQGRIHGMPRESGEMMGMGIRKGICWQPALNGVHRRCVQAMTTSRPREARPLLPAQAVTARAPPASLTPTKYGRNAGDVSSCPSRQAPQTQAPSFAEAPREGSTLLF